MNLIDDIAAALADAGTCSEIVANMGMRRGWDYWVSGEAATDGRGVAYAQPAWQR